MQEVVLEQNKAFQFQLSGIETVRVSCNNFNLEQAGLIHTSLMRQGSSGWQHEASASSLTAEAAQGEQHNNSGASSHSVFVQPRLEFHILPQETLWKYKAN